MTEWFVSSAVLTVLVIALRFALKGKVSPRLQYALWALVLLRLLVPFSFGEAFFSASNLTRQAARTEAGKAVTSFTQREVAFPSDSTALPEHEYQILDVPVDTTVPSAPVPAPTATGVKWNVGDIFTALWLLGAVIVGGTLFGSNLRFWLRLRKSRHKLNRPIYPLKVYLSNQLDTPCLFGLFRPSIYITPEAMENDTVLRHAVEHELSHFSQGDHIWSLLRGVCLALHWFDPFVWWAAVLSRNDSELACDEATVKRLGEGERAEYGRTLIGMTCQKRPALLTVATTMTGSKSSIKERIVTIAKKPKTSALALVLALVVAALAMGCTFTGAPASEEPPEDTGVLPEPDSVITVSTPLTSVPSEKPAESKPAESKPVEEDVSVAAAEATSAQNREKLEALLKELMAAGEAPQLTLYLADGTQCGSFYISPYKGDRFAALMASYAWTEVEEPTTQTEGYWLTAVSGDGTKSMAFLQNDGCGLIEYTDGEASTWWLASQGGDYPYSSIAESIRWEYDGLECDYERIAFQIDGTAEDAAAYFVNTAYGNSLTSLSPGNRYGVSDYRVMDWEVLDVSEDGKALVGWLHYAFLPDDPDSPAIWAGNSGEGTGEYQGMTTSYREFLLELEDDGKWYCTSLGTGGMSLKNHGLS